MNVEELLEMMEETLEAGTIVPFSASKRMVDVDRMRDIIDEVRNNLPDEIRESKKIVNDREQIMQNARIESESIIQQAEERARAQAAQEPPADLARAGLTSAQVDELGRALLELKLSLAQEGVQQYRLKIQRMGRQVIITAT